MTKKGANTADKTVHGKSSAGMGKEAKHQHVDDKSKAQAKHEDNTSGRHQKAASHPEEKSAAVIDELKMKLSQSEEKTQEAQDKYLRLSAEFDNYRKRTLKEKSDLIRLANEDLLKNLLPVIDDFERGIENVDKSQDIDALRQGIHLIYNKFVEFIKQNGIKEIDAKEQSFDLDFHEALTKIPAPSEELKGKVLDVIEKGYILNDKVIRYAKVVVGD